MLLPSLLADDRPDASLLSVFLVPMDFVVQNVSDESSVVGGQASVAIELFGWGYFGEVRPQ